MKTETLFLEKIASHRGSPWTAEDKDYVVLDDGRDIGRIMLHPQTPAGRPWFWTITDLRFPPSAHNKDY